MPPRLLFDLSTVDLDADLIPREELNRLLPQRFEFEQMERICHLDLEEGVVIGVRDLREDEFWVRGHMPGRPLFPGVLMLETAAQLGCIYTAKATGSDSVFGFGGADGVRFRRSATVGDRFVFIARPEKVTPRRSLFQMQGVVDGKVAFEAKILGIALPQV